MKKHQDGVKLNAKEKQFKREEKIIQQKLISEDEYKENTRPEKASDLQKERSKILEEVAKQRTFAKNELLKNLNPVLKEYMVEKIRMVLDKKELILADEALDITKEVMALFNKKIKSINFK